MKAANEFSLQELINHLQSFLIENKTNWLEQNFGLVYLTSFGHDPFLKLQEFCTDVVTNELDKICKLVDLCCELNYTIPVSTEKKTYSLV